MITNIALPIDLLIDACEDLDEANYKQFMKFIGQTYMGKTDPWLDETADRLLAGSGLWFATYDEPTTGVPQLVCLIDSDSDPNLQDAHWVIDLALALMCDELWWYDGHQWEFHSLVS